MRGQALAEVADQVGFGPGGLGGLHRGDRFLDEALRLRVGERLRGWRLRCDLGGLARLGAGAVGLGGCP